MVQRSKGIRIVFLTSCVVFLIFFFIDFLLGVDTPRRL